MRSFTRAGRNVEKCIWMDIGLSSLRVRFMGYITHKSSKYQGLGKTVALVAGWRNQNDSITEYLYCIREYTEKLVPRSLFRFPSTRTSHDSSVKTYLSLLPHLGA